MQFDGFRYEDALFGKLPKMKTVGIVQFSSMVKTRLFQFLIIASIIFLIGILLGLLDVKAPSFMLITIGLSGMGLMFATEFAPRFNQCLTRLLLQLPFVIMVLFAGLTYCSSMGYDHGYAYMAFFVMFFTTVPLGRPWVYKERQVPPWKWQHPWFVIPFVLVAPLFALLPLLFGLGVFDSFTAFVITATAIEVAAGMLAQWMSFRRQRLLEGRRSLIG